MLHEAAPFAPSRASLERRRFGIRLALFGIVLSAALGPGVFGRFIFTDDYCYAYMPVRNFNDGWTTGISQLRPLSGIVWGVSPYVVTNAHNGWRLRIFFLIGLIGAALVIDSILRYCGMTALEAGGMALTVCLVPGCAILAAWVICSLFSFALLLSAAGARLALPVILDESVGASRRALVVRLVGLVGCVAAALAIYQPPAMLFWALLAAGLIVAARRGARISLFRLALVVFSGLAAVGVYVLIAKSLIWASGVSANERAAAESNYIAKFRWFLEEPLTTALNVWRLDTQPRLAARFGICIAAGFPLAFLARLMRRQSWMTVLRSEAGLVALVCLAAPLCFLPNLLVESRWFAYRMLIPLTALVCLLLFESARNLAALLPRQPAGWVSGAVAAAFALFNAWVAGDTLLNIVARPQRAEMNYVRRHLAESGAPPSRVLVIPSSWDYSPASIARFDEFGIPSSATEWCARYVVWAAADQLGWEWRGMQVEAIEPAKMPTSLPTGTFGLDLRKLGDVRISPPDAH